eukprot:TRINITY_DN27994_c0_g1_i3.p2 TRINITY_DN27994_c0_g1~~TRINITY_DN27994_c0_g1_i3.p2  ORF type:complete len:418 (+),score=200.05 TRINITY_DN27994_c0_g1_i3:127-1380(+)
MAGPDSFITMAEFEGMRHDPQTILDRAGQYLNYLEQQQQALEEESKQQQGLRAESGKINYTPEQHAALVEHSAELELDHRDLSQKYVDLEHINNTIQGVVDALRADKQRLLDELAVLKEEQSKQVAAHTRLLSTAAELQELREGKQSSLGAHSDEINMKIQELQEYSDRVIEGTGRVIELQDHTEKVGSGRLALESETTALEQSTQQQERTIAYLQQELMYMDNEIKKKADETVALKKQMSSTILELQLQITKNEEEMSRVRTTVANEKDLTGRQNVWLAKDLQAKNQELLLARQQMTQENSDLKKELCLLREKAARMKSNVYLLERRNDLLHDDLQRLEAQDQFMKDSYLQRKDDAFKEMNEQAAVVAKITMELQTSREDLFMLKTKLCRNCKEAILGSEQPDLHPPGAIPSIVKP